MFCIRLEFQLKVLELDSIYIKNTKYSDNNKTVGMGVGGGNGKRWSERGTIERLQRDNRKILEVMGIVTILAL